MKEKIYKIVAESLSIDPSNLRDDFGPGDIPEWDSLAHQGVILSLEKELDIKFDIDDVLEMETIADIIEIMQEKTRS